MRLLARASLLVAATLLGLMVLTHQREFGVWVKREMFAAIGSGCLQVGLNAERFHYFYKGRSVGPLYTKPTWHHDWTLAWRPFRVYMGPTEHHVVVPLWPAAVLSLLIGGYAMGTVRGVRAARMKACLACGYELSGVAACSPRVQCSECGTWRTFIV